eukprot:3264427-Prymnesium_polylepis.1
MTVPKLKEALGELGLPTNGLKAGLIDRLLAAHQIDAKKTAAEADTEERPHQRPRVDRSVRERIIELNGLKDDNLVTQEEYDATKKAILADL